MDMLIDNACKVAEEFTKLFYEAMDKKRHTLNRFYMDSATIAWDGHGETGKDSIQKMLEGLPMTVHTLSTLDAQPVSSKYSCIQCMQRLKWKFSWSGKRPADRSRSGFG